MERVVDAWTDSKTIVATVTDRRQGVGGIVGVEHRRSNPDQDAVRSANSPFPGIRWVVEVIRRGDLKTQVIRIGNDLQLP